MLRHFFTTLLASATLLVSVNAAAIRADHGDIREINDNRPVVWPWSLATDFPWDSIQGFWKVEQDEYVSYFSIKRLKPGLVKGKPTASIQVRQYDGFSCDEIATGVGYEQKTAVLAQMTDIDGKSYRLKLTAFRFEDVEKNSVSPIQGKVRTNSVMVMSVKNMEAPNLTPVHIQITKISNTIGIKNCQEDVKR